MRGSIRAKGAPNRWEVRVALGRDPVTGRYRQKSLTVHGSKAEAQRVLRRLIGEVEDGEHPAARAEGEGRTFAELLDEWMTFKDTDERSPTTIDRYHRAIRLHLKPTLGEIPLSRLDPKLFDDLYRELLKRLKASTVLKTHLIARAALERGVRWGWLDRNPAALADPPKIRRPPIVLPSAQDVARLVALAEEDDPTFAAVLRVGAATGARRGELCALRWTDADLEAKTLTIERGVIIVSRGVVERPTKTHNRRVVALDDGTVSVLLLHRDREQKVAAECGVNFADDAFVFSRRPGGTHPIRPDNCTTTFERLRERAGLSGFSLKDATRHLAATRLIGAGVDVRTVAGRLGHARASTTLDIYSHFLPERDREAAEILGALLDGSIS